MRCCWQGLRDGLHTSPIELCTPRQVSPGVFRNNRGSSVLRGDHPASLRRIIMTWGRCLGGSLSADASAMRLFTCLVCAYSSVAPGDDSYWAHERMLESLAPGSPPAFQLQSGGVPYFEW